ncbi:MAG: hypothetical protein K2Q17_01180 [Nitrospiraceae bacterium]|uniref:hypothetical protein n=1 Tax=Nitrospira cf. moscoviensis SBR1015 TaxID=96242 RepID=UPI000A0DC702|nr:hypothetical protein [Nitrospira cf. moscoviensis SBR1015]MBY0246249.1 hypothetical protein [Nitrospiraceae bacterium]OQW33673.1 MAG: hypothetical protein A4E20_12565 [Nitrospira sp. SG-bin2]
MRFRCDLRLVVGLCVPLWSLSGSPVLAQDEPAKGPGVLERIGDTAKKVGHKIEQGVGKVVKKVEEKHIGEKVERKLKKAADKTAEGFKKAGNKIDQKLNH